MTHKANMEPRKRTAENIQRM